jgi:ABC-type lipoprotein export system ATPase subunit
VKVRDKYQVQVSNRFAVLGNLDVSENISMTWKNIRENIKISEKESIAQVMNRGGINHGFDEEYSKLLGQTKQAKLQWLQVARQIKCEII